MPLLAFSNPGEMALSVRASALVFEDPKSKELLKRIELVGPSEMNALVIGETGTGKELVARHLHKLSARKDGPFMAVNCAAFSENLIESELFGHEKGAFTGAVTAKQGWFEAASGGTLFLDEIGDLPLPLQVKLLRVLQEREVVRVGSYKPVPTNVRLIAATNVKLEEAVLAGRFREDLYYRLNVAAIFLPPLRERPGDILPLAHHFMSFYGQRLDCAQTVLSPLAEQALFSHAWPGNIRELENVLHHALLVARNRTITPVDLNLSLRPIRPQTSAGDSDLEELDRVLESLCDTTTAELYTKVERALLNAAYKHCKHNQLATARMLGLSRHVLRARLLHHGILAFNAKKSLGMEKNKYSSTSIADVPFISRAPLPAKSPSAIDQPSMDQSSDWWGF